MNTVLSVLLILSCVACSLQAPTAKQNLTQFITGIYSAYNLSTPNLFLDCFDENSSSNFLSFIRVLNSRENDLLSGLNVNYVKDQLQLNSLQAKINASLTCAFRTSDWSNLLKRS